MLTSIAKVIAGLAAAVGLAVTLLLLPATVTIGMESWLGPLARGGYSSMATAAVLAAIPFGLAFGLIPAQAVVGKALAISIGAAIVLFLLVASSGALHTTYAVTVAVECGVFIVLFSVLAAAGHRLSRRLHSPMSATLGGGAFLALFVLLTALPFYASLPKVPITPEARLDAAVQKVRDAKTDLEKFYALREAAKESFVLGHIDDARQFAVDLLRIAEQCRGDWNYGNAIHDGNLVLGRIALREGRVEDAKKFLLAAGGTPGSPQLDSFGPNMSLAKDLLEHGERDVVLQYFDLCRKFWELENGKLADWAKDIQAGKIPDFGANLLY